MTTTRARRVLVVDNDPDFRKSVELLLQAKGYTVFAAGTRLEAIQIAAREQIHVAVLDVRIESDPDHDDMSGLILAKQLDPLIVKIMVTAYPSASVVRSSFYDASAFTFVGKDELPRGLLHALAHAFAKRVGINFELAIHWQGIQLAEVAELIQLTDKPAPELIQLESEEILCKLFNWADKIEVSPLIPIDRLGITGQSGAVVLKVEPQAQDGRATPVVVKLAARPKIEAEVRNYKRYVERFIDGYRRTQLQDGKETHHLGGIVYSLVGAPLEECVDLGAFYADHSAEDIVTVLNNLFTKTCRRWYENRGAKQNYNLVDLYAKPLKLSPFRLEAALISEDMAEWLSSPENITPEGQQRLANPVEWLRQHPKLMANVPLAYTHGDLHSRNMLVDQNQQVWLIDFYRSGPGHFFRDLIELESDIKFALLEDTDLPSLRQFESALIGSKYFDDVPTMPSFKGSDLRKAYDVIQGLRQIAGRLAGPRNAMLDYYQGLLLQTLAMLYRRHLKPQQKRHVYVAASMLCQRLDNW